MKSVDHITPGKDCGVGTVRKCNMYNGNHAVERIKSWDKANPSYIVKLIDASFPMTTANVKLYVTEAGGGKSKLVAEMNLKAKYGFLENIMERLLIKPQNLVELLVTSLRACRPMPRRGWRSRRVSR
jgi:hypothetical protein